MSVILQSHLPPDMQDPKGLPGVAPCAADDWLRVDDAYAAQMAYRIQLLEEKRDAVLWQPAEALPAAVEALEAVMTLLPSLGFVVNSLDVICPDGRIVPLDTTRPLETACHLVQQDICVLEKRGDQHVLAAAVLCFPASWRLADKVGRPLIDIHEPVSEYDDGIARRVQRLFDGVQAGRPLWRMNWLEYAQADLHQPERRDDWAASRFFRSERQTILRLPRTQAVIFAIHTFVLPMG